MNSLSVSSNSMDYLPKITGIAEIVLNVDDLPKMKSFYIDVLGFDAHSEFSMETQTHDPAGLPTICFLTIVSLETPLGIHGHPQFLALIDFRRHVFAKRFKSRQPESSGLNHIAFEIPPAAYDAYLSHLQAHGLIVTQTEFPGMHARALFFDDPEGNCLELIMHNPEG